MKFVISFNYRYTCEIYLFIFVVTIIKAPILKHSQEVEHYFYFFTNYRFENIG